MEDCGKETQEELTARANRLKTGFKSEAMISIMRYISSVYVDAFLCHCEKSTALAAIN